MAWEKILLVYPPSNKIDLFRDTLWMLEPLGLEYVAAAFSGQDVKIVDMRLNSNLGEILKKYNPDLIGFTALSCHVNTVKRLIGVCKAILPECQIMLGGQHATVSPEEFEIPEIDIIVRGDGYGAIKELLNNNGRPEGVKGISVNHNGKFTKSSIRGYGDLDRQPFPRRDLIWGAGDKYHYAWYSPVASIRTSVGCPYRCSFCSIGTLGGGQYLVRSSENVIRELKGIKDKSIYITDGDSFYDSQRMMALAERIKDEGIRKKYIVWGRVDNIIKNRELVLKWKEIGLGTVMIGYESISPQKLDEMNKDITLKMQDEATEFLNEIGVAFEPIFIVDPDFGPEDFKALREYVRTKNFLLPEYSVMTPFPGTKLFAEQSSKIIENNWDYYDGTHPVIKTTLPKEEFYRQYNDLVKDTPLLNKLKVLHKYPLKRYPALLMGFVSSRLNSFRFGLSHIPRIQ